MPDIAPRDDAGLDGARRSDVARPRRRSSKEPRLGRFALWAGIVGALAAVLAIPGVMDHLLPAWVSASPPTPTPSTPNPSATMTPRPATPSPGGPTTSITGTGLRALKTLPMVAGGGATWRGNVLVIPCAGNTSADQVREVAMQLPEPGTYSRFTAQASAPADPNPDERVSVELFVGDVHIRADQTVHTGIRVLAPGTSGPLTAPLSPTANSLTLRVTCKYAGSQVELSNAGVLP